MLESKVEVFNKILQSFKINASCIEYKQIRNVSFYDLRLNPGGRIKDIEKFIDEISLMMRAKSRPNLKIEPELGILRLEIMDDKPHNLPFYEQYKHIDDAILPMYLGSSIHGKDIYMDMIRNPHLLIGGCTGSGKSTLLHILIANALMCHTKICVIDTKGSEFQEYSNIKQVDIADDYISSLTMINNIVDEMMYRFKLMKYDIIKYDRDLFPNILLIIDEFADLIAQDEDKKIYSKLLQLTQKCRAANIYCVLATQRPSADIIKGSIKANFPARIACQVASGIDSKIILDTKGAELLYGKGDAIIKNYNHNYCRFQIAYTIPKEILANVNKF